MCHICRAIFLHFFLGGGILRMDALLPPALPTKTFVSPSSHPTLPLTRKRYLLEYPLGTYMLNFPRLPSLLHLFWKWLTAYAWEIRLEAGNAFPCDSQPKTLFLLCQIGSEHALRTPFSLLAQDLSIPETEPPILLLPQQGTLDPTSATKDGTHTIYQAGWWELQQGHTAEGSGFSSCHSLLAACCGCNLHWSAFRPIKASGKWIAHLLTMLQAPFLQTWKSRTFSLIDRDYANKGGPWFPLNKNGSPVPLQLKKVLGV